MHGLVSVFVHDKLEEKVKKKSASELFRTLSWSTLFFYSSLLFESYTEQNWGFALTQECKDKKKLTLKWFEEMRKHSCSTFICATVLLSCPRHAVTT